MSRRPRLALLRSLVLLSALLAASAMAQTRAWLDRDRIALGETATLNIQTDRADAAAPDYAPLLRDFELTGNTSSRQYEVVNGVGHARTLFAVALQPRRAGVIGIPALAVGGQRTQPLTLTVTPAQAAPARAGDIAFIETEADAQSPYVQQAVGYTVRLYYDYATPLLSGQLDQDAPDAASLQRVGDDVQYTREVAGRRYTVVERHYLLIPERSGPLVIPGARFRGRGGGGFFDEMFGDGAHELHAASPPRFLDVRPLPAHAPQPWLPLHALDLRYLAAPQSARAGEAMTVTVEAIADGAIAAQMPELQLAAGDGAQVFADPVQASENFAEGRPQVRLARRFSVVPAQAGTLRISGPRMAWWDVRAGIARVASLPDVTVRVTPGAGSFATRATPAPAAASHRNDWVRVPGVQGPVRPWALATVAFALLWLATFAWALHRRSPAPAAGKPASAKPAETGSQAPATAAAAGLRRALDHGDLGDVAVALGALASPPTADLDAVAARLADARQRDAVAALQRARWGGGDGTTARALLRAAFRDGPRWTVPAATGAELLPPLYPPPRR